MTKDHQINLALRRVERALKIALDEFKEFKTLLEPEKSERSENSNSEL